MGEVRYMDSLYFGYSQLLLHSYSNLAVFRRKGETVMLTYHMITFWKLLIPPFLVLILPYPILAMGKDRKVSDRWTDNYNFVHMIYIYVCVCKILKW